jgi:FKBP-type peptidyl-prolyl cis-trans isomerase SlyD
LQSKALAQIYVEPDLFLHILQLQNRSSTKEIFSCQESQYTFLSILRFFVCQNNGVIFLIVEKVVPLQVNPNNIKSTTMKISNNTLVTLTYDLNVGDEGEELILMEQATTEKPLEFIFGTDSMLESFEKHLDGLSAGDKFSFTLSSEETYGEYSEEKVIKLAKKLFEIDGKIDDEMLFEGNTLPMMDADGNRLMGAILEIDGDEITMDFNHPLAGETLHFNGEVIGAREATAEEIAALQVVESDEPAGCTSSCGKSCGGCKSV